MKLLSAFAISLLLLTPAAYGASIFMPDAIFDFEQVPTTAPADRNGSGALDALRVIEPVAAGSGTITMDVSRQAPGGVGTFDVTEIDSRFPDEWFAALDPFVNSGDGSSCDVISDDGCRAFFTTFSFPLTGAEIEFTDLGGPSGSFDVFEVRLLSGLTETSSFVVPDASQIMAADSTDAPLNVTVDPNTGVIRVYCDGSRCQDQNFVSISFTANDGDFFRSLLFRGYETFDPNSASPLNSNSAFVGRVGVSVVPEPATVALFGFSAVSILALARRRRE